MQAFLERNRTAVTASVLALIGGTLIGWVVVTSGSGLSAGYPLGFVSARNSAAATSQEIVRLTGETSVALKHANEFDLAGDRTRSLHALDEARDLNARAAREAQKLSAELTGLTMSLDGFDQESRRLGYEAVATAFWLVGEFGNYTGYVDAFLAKLSEVVASRSPNYGAEVRAALGLVNTSVARINSLNAQFRDRMAIFDRAVTR